MKLRGHEFGPVNGASGVQGMTREGYEYHEYLKLLLGRRFSFKGVTFTAKTFTLHRNEGNMPLREDGLTPVEFHPKCIHITPSLWRQGVALNAVGLSNFGAKFYLDSGLMQLIEEPWMMSFMAISKTPDVRLEEFKRFLALLRLYRSTFRTPVALQQNISCPNVGLDPNSAKLVQEAHASLEVPADMDIPRIIKINVLVSPEAAAEIARHPACDAICVTNTLPWGSLPERVDWKKIFGSDVSPLMAKVGFAGGMSGAPLLPLLIQWLEGARGLIKKPIIAGGGILGPADVRLLSYTIARSVSLGSIVMLRPWRLAATIAEARRCFGGRD